MPSLDQLVYEYESRVSAGESIDPEIFANQYPEVRESLLEELAVSDFVREAFDGGKFESQLRKELWWLKWKRTVITAVAVISITVIAGVFGAGILIGDRDYDDYLTHAVWCMAEYEDHQDPERLGEAGYCFLELGDTDQAKVILEQAVLKGDDSPETMCNLGYAYYRLKMLNLAEECFLESGDVANIEWVEWTRSIRAGDLRDHPQQSLSYRRPAQIPDSIRQRRSPL